MKCPYRDFQECIVEQCPSCNYEEVKKTTIAGHAPAWMSIDEAIKQGYQWKETKTFYEFISCKLIDNSVQPIPAPKQTIKNITQTNVGVAVRKSLF